MKKVFFFLLTIAVLSIYSSFLRAEKFNLKYEESKDAYTDDLCQISGTHANKLPKKPDELKGIPKDASAGISYFSPKIGEQTVFFGIETKKRAEAIYADTNMNSDLSDEKAITPTEKMDGGIFFRNIKIEIPSKQGAVKLFISVWAYDNDYAYFQYSAAGSYKGKVKFGDKDFTIALTDKTLDGKYDKYMEDMDGSECDHVGIDFNNDERFAGDDSSRETFPLCKTFRVNAEYYSIIPASDGTSVTIEKVNPILGSLDTLCPCISLSVISDGGLFSLSGADGKWQLPIGKYKIDGILLIKKDDKGAEWRFNCPGYRAGRITQFEIREGETFTMKLGEPLLITTDAEFMGELYINLNIAGQGGEEYSAMITKNGEEQPAPKLKILDRDRKELKKDSFNYG